MTKGGERARGLYCLRAVPMARLLMLLLLLLSLSALALGDRELGCVMSYAGGQQTQPCPGCMPSAPDPDNPLSACTEYLEEWEGLVCCVQGQTDALKSGMILLEEDFQACGACIDNFWRLFCEYTCSPWQASFMSVGNTKVGANNQTLVNTTVIDIETVTAEAHYNSCALIPLGGGEVVERLWASADIFLNYIGAGGLQTGAPALAFNVLNSSDPDVGVNSTLAYDVTDCAGLCGCETCKSECQPPPHFDPHTHASRCTYQLGGATFDCLATAMAAAAAFGGLILALLTGLILQRVLLFSTVTATAIATIAALTSAGLFAAYMATAGSIIVAYAAWGVIGLAILLSLGLACSVRFRARSSVGRASQSSAQLHNNINGSDSGLWNTERSLVRRYWMWHGASPSTQRFLMHPLHAHRSLRGSPPGRGSCRLSAHHGRGRLRPHLSPDRAKPREALGSFPHHFPVGLFRRLACFVNAHHLDCPIAPASPPAHLPPRTGLALQSCGARQGLL